MLTLTESAKAYLRNIVAQRGGYPKLVVTSRGCAGHTYAFTWTSEATPQDEEIIVDDLTLLFERKWTIYVIGTHVDYYDGVMGRDFVFDNLSQRKCGCGKSFIGAGSEEAGSRTGH